VGGAIVFLFDFVVEIDIRISWYWSSLKKQTDGTRRRRRSANPDVESKFLKNNYTLNIPYMPANLGLLSCS
jgi:hypothetical protein